MNKRKNQAVREIFTLWLVSLPFQDDNGKKKKQHFDIAIFVSISIFYTMYLKSSYLYQSYLKKHQESYMVFDDKTPNKDASLINGTIWEKSHMRRRYNRR